MNQNDKEQIEDEVSIKDVLRVGAYAAIVAAVVVFGIGVMARAYANLRPSASIAFASNWRSNLFWFSLAAGIVAGALVVGWRLMHRRPNEPRWGMAVLFVVALLFAVVVWPTPWAYREYDCEIVQVHRITGKEGLRVKTPLCAEPRAQATRDPSTPVTPPAGGTTPATR